MFALVLYLHVCVSINVYMKNEDNENGNGKIIVDARTFVCGTMGSYFFLILKYT